MTQPITLPPLDIDCPDCTGEKGEQIRRENRAEWKKCNAEESAAYDKFQSTHEGSTPWDAWLQTDTYRALSERQPEELPEVGCVECDFTGKRITEFGSQVLTFLNRHYRR